MVQEQDQDSLLDDLREVFDDRQLGLINNCVAYERGDPSGLPGHNIMIIVSKLYAMLKEKY